MPMKNTNDAKDDEGADRRDIVPVGEGLRVVDVAARHALTAKEVLREEGQVRADEHHPEVQLAGPFRVLAARHLADPEIDPGKDARTRHPALIT